MEITKTKEELGYLLVELIYWDLSLKKVTSKHWSATIGRFPSTKPIRELDAVPLELFPDADQAIEKLRKRGQKIRFTPRGALKWFKGFVLVPDFTGRAGTTQRKWIEGRIIIDPEEYDKATNPNGLGQPIPVLDDEWADFGAPHRTIDSNEDVLDEHLIRSRSVFKGFSLTTKSWHEFEADFVSEVDWNDQVRKSWFAWSQEQILTPT